MWKNNSLSTPCSLVFDASKPTTSSSSLNDILGKRRNNMTEQVKEVIRWLTHRNIFPTNLQKMYNSVKLREEDWCLQRYLWQIELDPTEISEEKIMKTFVYSVKSNVNRAEFALREMTRLSKEQYPEIKEILRHPCG